MSQSNETTVGYPSKFQTRRQRQIKIYFYFKLPNTLINKHPFHFPTTTTSATATTTTTTTTTFLYKNAYPSLFCCFFKFISNFNPTTTLTNTTTNNIQPTTTITDYFVLIKKNLPYYPSFHFFRLKRYLTMDLTTVQLLHKLKQKDLP